MLEFVKNITVLFFKIFSNIFFANFSAKNTSNWAKGSSNKYKSTSLYIQRAKFILFFYPPDKLSPFSAITVWSLFIQLFISSSSPHAAITYLYRSSMNFSSITILSLKVPCIIQGSYVAILLEIELSIILSKNWILKYYFDRWAPRNSHLR